VNINVQDTGRFYVDITSPVEALVICRDDDERSTQDLTPGVMQALADASVRYVDA
jgi:hypothetical protein